MKIIKSPWAEAFLSLVASAKTSLRLVAPYYSKEVIKMVLDNSNGSVRKEFIFALREQDVLAGMQSAKAVRLLKKTPKCTARIAKRLHAKFIIADEQRAIVTSSNLTHNGLFSNAEVGVYIDEQEAVKSLVTQFNTWFSDSGQISISELGRLVRVEAKSKHQGTGKVYGNKLTIGQKSPKHLGNRAASSRGLARAVQTATKRDDGIGWILIHSKKRYPDGSPIEELRELGNHWKGRWLWKLPKPLNKTLGKRLLFSWQGNVFGESPADVVGLSRRSERFNFAFELKDYMEAKKMVPLEALTDLRGYHSLIKAIIYLNNLCRSVSISSLWLRLSILH